MADIGIPFGFVNPERYGQLPLPSSSSPRAASRCRTTTSFSLFRGLPAELRITIMKLHIEEILDRRMIWFATNGKTLVKYLRRGVLRWQLQDKRPPSLAPVACVNKEWQAEIEKQLFSSLPLVVVPDSEPSEHSDLDNFSAFVAGPRRRDLKGVQLRAFRAYSTYQQRNSQASRAHCTGGSPECMMRLLRALGTWAPEEFVGHLLIVELHIMLRDVALHYFQEEIRNLATIKCVGALYIYMDPHDFSKLPLALLDLFRKLPSLRSTRLYLSPWCFSREDDRDYKIQEFMRGIRTETPQLTEVEFSHPFLTGETEDLLTGIPIASIRETSYRLKILKIVGPIDLSLFFEQFYNRAEDGEIASRPQALWPHLEELMLRGPIVTGGDDLREPEKDAFLQAMGHAINEMPKLKVAGTLIGRELNVNSVARLDRMEMIIILFADSSIQGRPKHHDTEKAVLKIASHTPSDSAVRI